MKRVLIAVTMIALLGITTACATSNAATEFGNGSVTLRIGDQQQIVELPLKLSGELDNLPYKVQFDEFGSGPLVNQAFGAGAINVGFMGDTPAMFAQASNLPLKAIAVSATNGPGTTLLARPGSGIHSLADLRGKKIATTSNTAPDGFLLRVLAAQGLTVKDITLVDVPLLNLGNILQSGTVDAATVSQQQLVDYEQQHPDAVALTNSRDFHASYSFTLASSSALDDPATKAALLDFVQRLVKSNNWVNSHAQQWITQYYVNTLKQTPAAGQLIYQGSGSSTYIPIDQQVRTNQQNQADLWVRNGLIPSHVDISPQFDDSIISEFNKSVAAAQQPGA
ncbi:MAG TPA: ABC transporter substrate-binding protein [Pseudonocardiaceae bacterium]|jgi:sulfonate transport system substrate-binding protein|nr:ABC transporter substrate-binding protein [Pseudonocardiaceae bacterium]